jgi:pre-mRNA-splicing factor SYF1
MEEAAFQLAMCVNDDAFLSPKGTTKHALWMRLCDMCAKHPQAVSKRLKVDAIIRSGLARFTDETGKLWCKLADYYIRLGQFERARDVYEEALATYVFG